jgi:hypothetical protein
MAMIHVNRGATSLGIFAEDQVREGLRAGRFLPSDLGWRDGMANWQQLSQFPEFVADVGSASRPPPPQPAATSTIAPSMAGSAPESAAPRGGLPWDHRQEKGLFSAFIETLQMVLTRPSDAFTAMKREGGFGEPLLYAIIGGTVGLVVYFLYRFAFHWVWTFSSRPDLFAHFFGGIGLILLLILAPVMIVISVFINSAILHVCLMIVGGAKQSFETTFRVVCFSGGSVQPLMIIPVCGIFIAGAWDIVLRCIGLARAHETDTGRAVLAVLLPLIVCCGGGLLIAMMFGALGAWSATQH